MIQLCWTGIVVASALSVAGITLCGEPATSSLLVHNARIIPMADDEKESFLGYFAVDENGRITEIREGKRPDGMEARVVVDAEEKIVMPGFLSGHSHPWQSAWRGFARNENVWPWLQRLHWTYGRFIGRGDWYTFTLHGDQDHLRHGITTWLNYSQRFGASEEVYLEQFHADVDSGGHFVFSYVVDPDSGLEEGPGNFRRFLELGKVRPGGERCLRVNLNSMGIHLNKELLRTEVEIARDHNLEMHFHYLESSPGADQGDRFDWFEETGVLERSPVFAHFIHTNNEILRKSVAAEASMVWNPLSNGRLASGLPDIPLYRKMGIKIAMGVDGQASADIADPFENMRMGAYALRMKYGRADVLSPREIVRMHTIDTARVLRVDDSVGSLEIGKFADFLIVNTRNPDIDPPRDLFATLVFACSAANIESVYVAGREVVKNGAILGRDSESVTRETIRRRAAVMERQRRKDSS